jgi:hypothetical protein
MITATNAARDSFTSWDAQHQQWIVDQAGNHAEGETALVKYRGKRETILKAFAIAYQAMASAAAILPLVERGEREQMEFDAFLTEALQAILVIKAAIEDIS